MPAQLWTMDSNHKTVSPQVKGMYNYKYIVLKKHGYIPHPKGKRKLQDSKFAFSEDILVLRENMLTSRYINKSWASHEGKVEDNGKPSILRSPNFGYNDHFPYIIHAIPEANFL